MASHLNRDLRDARQRPAILARQRREVTDHEDIGRARNRQVGLDLTRPARSSGAPSAAPSGEAATPAAQSTVSARIDSLPIETTPGDTWVTMELVRTVTPSRRDLQGGLTQILRKRARIRARPRS